LGRLRAGPGRGGKEGAATTPLTPTTPDGTHTKTCLAIPSPAPRRRANRVRLYHPCRWCCYRPDFRQNLTHRSDVEKCRKLLQKQPLTYMSRLGRATISGRGAHKPAGTNYPSFPFYRFFATGTIRRSAKRALIGRSSYRTTLLPRRMHSVSRLVMTSFRYTSGSKNRKFCCGPRRYSPRVVRHLER
jgi:hypothetical protein